jgi:hypothetical protein
MLVTVLVTGAGVEGGTGEITARGPERPPGTVLTAPGLTELVAGSKRIEICTRDKPGE